MADFSIRLRGDNRRGVRSARLRGVKGARLRRGARGRVVFFRREHDHLRLDARVLVFRPGGGARAVARIERRAVRGDGHLYGVRNRPSGGEGHVLARVGASRDAGSVAGNGVSVQRRVGVERRVVGVLLERRLKVIQPPRLRAPLCPHTHTLRLEKARAVRVRVADLVRVADARGTRRQVQGGLARVLVHGATAAPGHERVRGATRASAQAVIHELVVPRGHVREPAGVRVALPGGYARVGGQHGVGDAGQIRPCDAERGGGTLGARVVREGAVAGTRRVGDGRYRDASVAESAEGGYTHDRAATARRDPDGERAHRGEGDERDRDARDARRILRDLGKARRFRAR
mmetsp:Transcript_9989/g.41944  ORF Transcript_9989/g.41944 Transcript_9989/m.41944 type:complete len:346 (-) Transcript_9989:137-1174(-)